MSEFSFSRSLQINADPQRVHALIDDLRKWVAWSPWEELDPDLKHTYTGPASGVGAKNAWQGNKKAGEGSMTITASSLQRVDLDLAFIKPFKAENTISFLLDPNPDGTRVTWRMTGQQSPISKLFFKLFRVEKGLGRDFDRGLAKLKSTAERG